MKPKLQRHYGRKDLHFITFSCFQRRSLLESGRARNLFVKILAEVRERYAFLLVGYVVMPEHVHLLISEPVQGTPSKVSLRFQCMEQGKAEGKVELHACEPGDEKTGKAPKGLAVEQLEFLREGRGGIDSDRSSWINKKKEQERTF